MTWLYVPDTDPPDCDFRIAAFFAGIGAMEVALELALERFGVTAATVCSCEWDGVAAALGVVRAQAAHHAHPVWDDITTFDGRPWRGQVDCMSGGIPCPSFNAAARLLGHADLDEIEATPNHTIRVDWVTRQIHVIEVEPETQEPQP